MTRLRRGDDAVADSASDETAGRPTTDDRRVARTIGALVGAVGALGIAASAYLDWFAGQMPTEIPLERLFATDVSGTASSYWTSMAAPLALAGLIGVVGGLLRSRLTLLLAGLLGFATLVLWVLLQAIDLAPEDLGASDYEAGVWVCVASLAVLAGGVLLMGGRTPKTSSTVGNPGPVHESATPTEPTVAGDTRRASEV
jgi:hypothetical protein